LPFLRLRADGEKAVAPSSGETAFLMQADAFSEEVL